jgi:hypothetical protein
MAALIGAATASATTTIYWGYNNLTPNNPPASAGECPGVNDSGIACSGWNNWDRSQIDYNSGNATIRVAMNNPNSSDYPSLWPTSSGTYTLVRTTWNQTHHGPGDYIEPYNRAACFVSGGYAYTQ